MALQMGNWGYKHYKWMYFTLLVVGVQPCIVFWGFIFVGARLPKEWGILDFLLCFSGICFAKKIGSLRVQQLLVGGFKYFSCSPLFGEDSHFD